MMNTAVLVSGGGTNLQALIDYEMAHKADGCPYTIKVVMSDHKDAYAVERAKNAGIPAEIVSPYAVMGADVAKAASREEKREAVSNAVLSLCNDYNIDAIVLAGWLTVNSGKLIKAFENRMINLHPALLPKFRRRRNVGASRARGCSCRKRNGKWLYRSSCRRRLRYRKNSRTEKSSCPSG